MIAQVIHYRNNLEANAIGVFLVWQGYYVRTIEDIHILGIPGASSGRPCIWLGPDLRETNSPGYAVGFFDLVKRLQMEGRINL